MELSSEEPIFKLIDELKKNMFDNEVSLTFLNNSDWTESEFNNFMSILRNNYPETIDDEYLEVGFNDIYLKIFKISNILSYCNTNNYKNLNHKWFNKTSIKNDKIDNLFDVNLEFDISKITDIEPYKEWDTQVKKFKLVKKFNYDLGNGIIASASILKSNNKDFLDLKKSKILTSSQKYDFTLTITNTTHVLASIIMVIKALFLSNIILTKKQQTLVLKDYTELVKKTMQLPPWFSETPLLTPKPITLEKVNMINPDDYGAISILRNYTVTEKADGERFLMYVNGKGQVFLINSSLKVEDTGIKAKKEAFNSLIDGEYVNCSHRIDNIKKNLFAAFDIFFINGKSLTSLPLISDDKKEQSRNSELLKVKGLLDTSKSDIEFIVKVHRYSDNILNDCKTILDNPDNYPYEIDGLIFTPAKLAVNSFYPSLPAPITQNMGWDRLFKWKPPEQNTIDFLVRFSTEVKKDGIKYKKLGLYVGFNPITTKDMTIEEGLRLRYDKDYSRIQFIEQKERIKKKEDFIPTLFKPMIYYHSDVEYAFIQIDTKGNIRAENNDNIDDEAIVEFRYDLDKKQWIPIRVREDKTRIFKKGIFSKTANSLPVAINIWRSIHNPISKEMIVGAAEILDRDIDEDIQGKLLEADDVYYARGIPRKMLLSYNMITFHKTIINESLYKKPKHKNALLELACGQAGDMSRWIAADFKFVLGIDFAKDNIYKANDGAYARVIKEYNRFTRTKATEKGYFLNTAFAAGDCSLDIRSGEAGVDDDSKKLLKLIMNNNNKNMKPYLKHVAGKGANKFDAVTCMFAIHYFFKSEETLDGFLNNVSSNLKKDGIFICTFMDGESVERALASSENGLIEGRNLLDNTNILIWAIIKRFTTEDNYNKKVDVFIENTQRLIPEYLVNFNFLLTKAKEYGLELEDSELFSTTFKNLKDKIPEEIEKQTSADKTLLDLDKEEVQKKFSFLNRWAVFKKID